MKIYLFTLLFCAFTYVCLAQQKEFPVLDEYNRPANYYVNTHKSKTPLMISVDAGTKSIKPFNRIPNDPLGNIVFLENAKEALVTLLLKKDSLKYYRYTIIEDDKNVIVKDAVPSIINFVWNERSDFPGFLTMDLGVKSVINKKLTIKVYRLPESEMVSTLIIYNKPLPKAHLLKVQLISDTITKDKFVRRKLNVRNGASFHMDRNTKYLYIPMQKTDLDLIFNVYIFRVHGDQKRQISLASITPFWKYDSPDNNAYFLLAANLFEQPGEYKIHIIPNPGNDYNISELFDAEPQFSFGVLKGPKVYSLKDLSLIVAVFLVVVGSIAGILVFTVRKRAFNKLQAAKRKAEITKGQLEHIRSQLNPHFIYNSLSGIQNLINKNEVENANTYLSKFARLTRNVLNEKELISIEDEVHLLDDYLSIEQLRFSFDYDIKVDEKINLLHVEIPTMLIQPFVENASKHSMSLIGAEGKLVVEFTSLHQDLIIKVSDNGKGFNVNSIQDGLGLKLCRKRIDLLNQLYPECPLSLQISSDVLGTVVNISLKNWL